jgi:hypothetical protein
MTSEFDRSRLKRYRSADRKSLVELGGFAKTPDGDVGMAEFLDSLPDFLAARDFRELVGTILAARENKRPVHLAMGAHVLKVGLAPVLLDLFARGLVTGTSWNGAAAVHDIEIALMGGTSEDVAEAIRDGSFGMAEDTAQLYCEAVARAKREGAGLGASVGAVIEERALPHREHSVFRGAFVAGIPATVHSAIGTDIVHMHPELDAGALGEASHRDFLALAGILEDFEGGVFVNIGSAVILPEVFLKALSMARNVSGGPVRFTTANFDMIRQYRPGENVLKRPGGRAINITGHHELMLPLLRAALVARIGGGNK